VRAESRRVADLGGRTTRTRLILETPEAERFRAAIGVAPPDVDGWPPNESDPERPDT
jgi:hypothetical protein